MADQSDVETTIVGIIAAAIYPSGTSAASIVGKNVRVSRGWPIPDNLDADLKAGLVTVTVTPRPGMTRNTSRYLGDSATTYATPTLTVTQSANVFTFAGTGGANQVAGIYSGTLGYAYRLGANDTPATVAAALTALIPGATASGAVVTIPAVTYMGAQIGADATYVAELDSIEQQFAVSVWCANPADRDTVCQALMPALSALPRIVLPDTSIGRMRYAGAFTSDRAENASLYRRDLFFSVDYETTTTQTLPVVLFPGLTLAGGNGATVKSGELHP